MQALFLLPRSQKLAQITCAMHDALDHHLAVVAGRVEDEVCTMGCAPHARPELLSEAVHTWTCCNPLAVIA